MSTIDVPTVHGDNTAAADTSPPRPSRRIGRSIGAVFAGLLTIAVLDNLIDFILHSTGVFPPVGQSMADGLFLLALAYRTVDAIIGSYVTASLAPNRPMRHALSLGVIGILLSSLGVLATLAGGPELGPLWYPLSLVAICLPCTWIGGKLVEARQPTPATAALA
jgi:hypothetical protein